jgi:hypothetical protein
VELGETLSWEVQADTVEVEEAEEPEEMVQEEVAEEPEEMVEGDVVEEPEEMVQEEMAVAGSIPLSINPASISSHFGIATLYPPDLKW